MSGNNRDSQDLALRARAFSVGEFCRLYGVGRTTAYAEMKAGRLARRKVGKRSLITEDDAEAWLRALPVEPA